MKQNARFYFSNSARSEAFETDKGMALLEEVATALQGENAIFSIALMQEPRKGAMLLLKKNDVTGVALTPLTKKKKKKKKAPQLPQTPSEEPAAEGPPLDTQEA